jgi:apolipoprotein N-acyltransferase
LFFAWPVSPLTPLIFIAWVPLLYMAQQEVKRLHFFVYCYLAMLIWNTGTTWWIWNSTGPGAVGAIVANSLLMCLPLWGFHVFKTKYGNKAGSLALIAFWLSFEYIHLNWQLSWPWLTLGNVFATHPGWIQWYEYTGVSGGSLWVLLANVTVLNLLQTWKNGFKWKKFATAAAVLIIPFLTSALVNPSGNDTSQTAQGQGPQDNVVIVQPNIDPYSEKFDVASTSGQIQKLITLSEQQVDTNTRLVIWPETALPVGVWQDQVDQTSYYQPVFQFINRHPNLTLETGIETFRNYGTEKTTNTARKNESNGTYFDVFNAAISLKANQPIQFYNKSKLVPGVETLPDFLLWMGAIFEKFGGTAGGYGHDKEAVAFKNKGNPYVTAPIICYESIYGEYVTNYVRKGANLLTIMTNDGWWANTPGHRQHLNYARLRAIETRKWVARSANTGISAVIDSRGELTASRPWDEAAAIKYAIPAIAGETFYVRNGAYIFGFAVFLLLVMLGYHFIMLLRTRFITKN